MSDILETVRANANLEEGVPLIERVLTEVYLQAGVAKKVLARSCHLPVPVMVAVSGELRKVGLIEDSSGLRLTAQGREFVERELDFAGINLAAYKQAIDGTFSITDFLAQQPYLAELLANRPSADVTLDQSKCLAETSIKRALLCLRTNSLLGKRVLCLGDDDLVSVAIGALLKHLFGARRLARTLVQVFEVDARISEYIKNAASAYEFPVQCHQLNLRDPLPQEYRSAFDCFFTDPPYTLEGLKLFLSRGIDCLKKMDGLSVFLSFAHRSPDTFLPIQKCLCEMGLVIAELVPRFNIYEGAAMLANASQMVVLKTTAMTTSLVHDSFEGALYTGELRQTVRVYQCQGCKRRWKIGSSEIFATIDELKQRGCPACRGVVFDLRERNSVKAEGSAEGMPKV